MKTITKTIAAVALTAAAFTAFAPVGEASARGFGVSFGTASVRIGIGGLNGGYGHGGHEHFGHGYGYVSVYSAPSECYWVRGYWGPKKICPSYGD